MPYVHILFLENKIFIRFSIDTVNVECYTKHSDEGEAKERAEREAGEGAAL